VRDVQQGGGRAVRQKFLIQVFGPGEIVPAFQVFDAVSNNTVEMGNSGPTAIGKDLAFAFSFRHSASTRGR
jgi:TRAP-type mannitol/chloroaromatic compound transport system substrate-binding protein